MSATSQFSVWYSMQVDRLSGTNLLHIVNKQIYLTSIKFNLEMLKKILSILLIKAPLFLFL